MTEVLLSGQLLCASAAEASAVSEHLDHHVALTRAEEGCVSFDVTPTDDPLVWRVEERFRDVAALTAHQERAAASEWGRVTAGIQRRYSVEGLG